MPLRDHSEPRLLTAYPWTSFHSAWAVQMAELLNRETLPSPFYALPQAKVGGNAVEIDVATVKEFGGGDPRPGRAFVPWTPPAASATLSVDLSQLDDFEVRVQYQEGELV